VRNYWAASRREVLKNSRPTGIMPATAIRVIAGAFLASAILAAIASSQSLTASQAVNPVSKVSSQIEVRWSVAVELAKLVDAKKTKPGSQIEARLSMDLLSHGQIVLPRGTKIIGHIIAARARTKQGTDSMVEIVFDRIVLRTGREIPLKAKIQAVGAPIGAYLPSQAAIGDMDLARQTESRPGPGPNEMKNVLASYPGSRLPANSAGGAEEPTADTGSYPNKGRSLGSTSQGVVGMKGVALSHTAQSCVISSSRENIHLSRGTQLVLLLLEPQLFDGSPQRTN
jgi:hypothetical protein